MSDDKTVTSLIAFGNDQLRVLGKKEGSIYLKRCFALWERTYGSTVTSKARAALTKSWREAQ